MAARGPGIELRPADPDRGEVGKLPRPQHDQRPADQFAADLEAETDRSLRQDPERWPWQRTTDVPDHRKDPHKAQFPEAS